MARSDPTLVINPRSDEGFVRWAHAILAEEQGLATPERLQRRLRQRYRDAVVRSRQLSGEATDVWYVYRDGRWIPDDPPVGGIADAEGGGPT